MDDLLRRAICVALATYVHRVENLPLIPEERSDLHTYRTVEVAQLCSLNKPLYTRQRTKCTYGRLPALYLVPKRWRHTSCNVEGAGTV